MVGLKFNIVEKCGRQNICTRNPISTFYQMADGLKLYAQLWSGKDCVLANADYIVCYNVTYIINFINTVSINDWTLCCPGVGRWHGKYANMTG